jgi:hypothetical protein
LNEERQLWVDQRDILNGALSEMDHALSVAARHPNHVECPTCGQEYENSLTEQFGLVEDVDGLIAARLNSIRKIADLDSAVRECRSDLTKIEQAIVQVTSIFAIRKAELTFRDVVVAEGRTEAARLLQTRLTELDTEFLNLTRAIAEQSERIKDTESKNRTNKIKDEFLDLLTDFSKKLDVRLADRKKLGLSGVNIGRGSEGPRALLAYYFAFLRIAQSYSSSVFCPIVIDAPNQQGQDRTHMPAMMRLMIDEAPKGSQMIIATEDKFGLTDNDVESIDVSGQKDHVLRLDQYEPIEGVIRPYLGLLI